MVGQREISTRNNDRLITYCLHFTNAHVDKPFVIDPNLSFVTSHTAAMSAGKNDDGNRRFVRVRETNHLIGLLT